jgi:hypothetical protein
MANGNCNCVRSFASLHHPACNVFAPTCLASHVAGTPDSEIRYWTAEDQTSDPSDWETEVAQLMASDDYAWDTELSIAG